MTDKFYIIHHRYTIVFHAIYIQIQPFPRHLRMDIIHRENGSWARRASMEDNFHGFWKFLFSTRASLLLGSGGIEEIITPNSFLCFPLSPWNYSLVLRKHSWDEIIILCHWNMLLLTLFGDPCFFFHYKFPKFPSPLCWWMCLLLLLPLLLLLLLFLAKTDMKTPGAVGEVMELFFGVFKSGTIPFWLFFS